MTLSTWLMIAAPSMARMIACMTCPVANSHAAMGSQMTNAPMIGMMLTITVASAQKSALGTPSEK